MIYPLASIFLSLQGEGHFVGYPTCFVRFAGCSVQDCHIREECDEAPWRVNFKLSPAEVVARVREKQTSGIVCITGGEPTDHDLRPMISALHDAGYRVHMETSGARPVLGVPIEWLTVSPKVLTGGGLNQRVGHALKIVIRPEWSKQQAWDIVTSIDTDTDFFHRYLQPMTLPSGETNVRQVIDMLIGANGYNANARWALSVQAHKSWGLK